MMNKFVTLVVALVVSVFDTADAVSCYQCNYTNSEFLGKSTCTEPLNATITAKCSAPMCTWQFVNYTLPWSLYLVYRECVNDSSVMQTGLCEQYRTNSNHTTFSYGDSCCQTVGPVKSEGLSYSMTVCFCQKDNCNGNIPLTLAPSTVAPSTISPSIVALSTVVPSTVASSTVTPSTEESSTVEPSIMASSTTTIKSTNAMPLLKPSISGNWSLVVVTIVWMVAKVISTG